ncbi:MAG: DoxX family membrane protein [Marinilabiliaceae bacterium]
MILQNIKKTLPLFVLRTAIGWLFLHEGLYKLITPGWTAQYYLAESEGPLQGLFQWIVSSEFLTTIANYGVVFLLILAGILLLTGFLERIAAVVGMLLLVFFYLAYPPFSETSSMMAEGNYLLVDKNFIMFLALWVIWQFRPGISLGLDRLLVSSDKKN